jgi:hypothetical protein
MPLKQISKGNVTKRNLEGRSLEIRKRVVLRRCFCKKGRCCAKREEVVQGGRDFWRMRMGVLKKEGKNIEKGNVGVLKVIALKENKDNSPGLFEFAQGLLASKVDS